MANYADLKAQIASDLRRSNLPNEIAEAILSAIRDHGAERFYWNEVAVYSFNTVPALDDGTGTGGTLPAQDSYAIDPQPPIQEFIKIDMVRSQVGNTWYDLRRESMDDIERLYSSVASTGQPYRYGVRGNEMRIYPLPADAYPIRIFGHYRLIELVNDGDANDWTNVARNLIRYSALKRLFYFPIRDPNQAQVAEAAEVKELEYLRRQTDRRARSGRMAAYYG